MVPKTQVYRPIAGDPHSNGIPSGPGEERIEGVTLHGFGFSIGPGGGRATKHGRGQGSVAAPWSIIHAPRARRLVPERCGSIRCRPRCGRLHGRGSRLIPMVRVVRWSTEESAGASANPIVGLRLLQRGEGRSGDRPFLLLPPSGSVLQRVPCIEWKAACVDLPAVNALPAARNGRPARRTAALRGPAPRSRAPKLDPETSPGWGREGLRSERTLTRFLQTVNTNSRSRTALCRRPNAMVSRRW